MAPVDAAIQNLLEARATYLARIQEIEAALELLARSDHTGDFTQPLLPRTAGVRDTILMVLADHDGSSLDVGAVYDAAVARGWRTVSANPRNTVASMLSKLASAGVVEKAARGRYRLVEQTEQLAVA